MTDVKALRLADIRSIVQQYDDGLIADFEALAFIHDIAHRSVMEGLTIAPKEEPEPDAA